MKNTLLRLSRRAAYTLAETLVATGVFAIAGGIVFAMSTTSLSLFSRNMAVNGSHEKGRTVVDRISRDIRASIAIPALLDDDLSIHTGSGSAAGIGLLLPAGPSPGSTFQVSANAAAGQNVIQITTGSFTPTVGMRLLIPTHQLEANITAVAASGTAGKLNLTLATPIPYVVTVTSGATTYNVVALFANRSAYVTVFPANSAVGEIRFFKNVANAQYSVVANDVTSLAPFNLPIY